MSAPSIVVLAGPNGAGKTTAAPFLLRDALAIREYVNADPIAVGLSAFAPESVAIAAGRVMLARMDELARQRASFGFETTLASRSFAPWLRRRIADDGYEVHLVFLWLASPELAIARVAHRVEQGGHFVPEDVVRRRYAEWLAQPVQAVPRPRDGLARVRRERRSAWATPRLRRRAVSRGD